MLNMVKIHFCCLWISLLYVVVVADSDIPDKYKVVRRPNGDLLPAQATECSSVFEGMQLNTKTRQCQCKENGTLYAVEGKEDTEVECQTRSSGGLPAHYVPWITSKWQQPIIIPVQKSRACTNLKRVEIFEYNEWLPGESYKFSRSASSDSDEIWVTIPPHMVFDEDRLQGRLFRVTFQCTPDYPVILKFQGTREHVKPEEPESTYATYSWSAWTHIPTTSFSQWNHWSAWTHIPITSFSQWNHWSPTTPESLPTTASPPASSGSSDSAITVAALAGIAVSGVCFIALLVVLVVFICYWKNRNNRAQQQKQTTTFSQMAVSNPYQTPRSSQILPPSAYPMVKTGKMQQDDTVTNHYSRPPDLLPHPIPPRRPEMPEPMSGRPALDHGNYEQPINITEGEYDEGGYLAFENEGVYQELEGYYVKPDPTV